MACPFFFQAAEKGPSTASYLLLLAGVPNVRGAAQTQIFLVYEPI